LWPVYRLAMILKPSLVRICQYKQDTF